MEQQELDDILATVRTFIREEVVPLEPKIEEDDEIPARLRQACKDMGLYGFAIPEEYGGIGLSMAQEAERGNKHFSHFSPDTNLFEELERAFRDYGETGTATTRHYVHDAEESALHTRNFATGIAAPGWNFSKKIRRSHGAEEISDLDVAYLVGANTVAGLET